MGDISDKLMINKKELDFGLSRFERNSNLGYSTINWSLNNIQEPNKRRQSYNICTNTNDIPPAQQLRECYLAGMDQLNIIEFIKSNKAAVQRYYPGSILDNIGHQDNTEEQKEIDKKKK